MVVGAAAAAAVADGDSSRQKIVSAEKHNLLLRSSAKSSTFLDQVILRNCSPPCVRDSGSMWLCGKVWELKFVCRVSKQGGSWQCKGDFRQTKEGKSWNQSRRGRKGRRIGVHKRTEEKSRPTSHLRGRLYVRFFHPIHHPIHYPISC
jgi:hypothetical protein